jgi:hypothetical protein
MSRDSVQSVYSDARTEYTKQLSVYLVPSYFQFYINLLEKAKQMMVNEPKRSLWQFQNLLNEIHDWNMEKVHQEIHTIQQNANCDYLEDLLTAVFIAHTKVLTAIRLSSNQKKVEINVPKVDHFLFKALCETSKLLWSSTYLFRDGISGMEKQQNYRNIEGILQEGIMQAIRSMVPVKNILRDVINQDSTNKDDAKEDSDDEADVKEEVPQMVTMEPTPSVSPLLPPPLSQAQPAAQLDSVSAATASPDDTKQEETQTIIIPDKPTVRFGLFDAVFDSENPNESEMVYDPKESEDIPNPSNESVPVLHIEDDETGVPLTDEMGIESLDEPSDIPEPIGQGDYEEL